jgi:hypothetical protein
MKMPIYRLILLSSVLFLLAACSNIAEKRSMLAAAGFQTVPATTPAQLSQLQSIKSKKVFPLVGKNGTIYLFADQEKKALMVGSPAQFQQYRLIKLRQQRVDEQLLDAQINMDNADYSAWGNGANWGWGVASAPY